MDYGSAVDMRSGENDDAPIHVRNRKIQVTSSDAFKGSKSLKMTYYNPFKFNYVN